ncbi:major facilitator superfamily multidrug-resistance, DHA1 sub-family [Mycena latifolia]|nr:major facilitator superfamily multidrug-resistance, DHA1 sub-family [Mycena latifolia]
MAANACVEHVPRRTPLPIFQLFILLFVQFTEPITALVIYPFVVQLVRDTGIAGGDETKTGFYSGLLESTFFLAEGLTVFHFGRLSDIWGRRPVLLLGPFGLALSMLGFGLSKTFWALLGFRCAQGAFNGNLGVAKTIMMEISDASNVADILPFIAVMWGIGATLGPFMGGILANPTATWLDTVFGGKNFLQTYPYFLPCAAAACIALAAFACALVGLRETLPSAIARRKQNERETATETDPLLPGQNTGLVPCDPVRPLRELLTRPVCIALLNSGVLAFSELAFDCMLPLVYATPIAIGGLGLSSYDIGLIMGIYGISNAAVQILFGGRIIKYFGARRIFNGAFCGQALAFSGYALLSIFAKRAGRIDAVVLVVLVCQLICASGVYPAYAVQMVFIVDAAPNQGSMGTLTGLQQMVGTTLRSAAPAFASSLFSLSVKNDLVGGYLVYGILASLALGGLRCSLLLPRRLRYEAGN